MTIQFATFTSEEMNLAMQIAKRAVSEVFNPADIKHDVMDVTMDLEATSATCPLDLQKLADFDAGNFGHDIAGIYRHLNRETGEMMNCFVPRCALPETVAA